MYLITCLFSNFVITEGFLYFVPSSDKDSLRKPVYLLYLINAVSIELATKICACFTRVETRADNYMWIVNNLVKRLR